MVSNPLVLGYSHNDNYVALVKYTIFDVKKRSGFCGLMLYLCYV